MLDKQILYLVHRDLVEDDAYRAVDGLIQKLAAGSLPTTATLSKLGKEDRKMWTDALRAGPYGSEAFRRRIADPRVTVGYRLEYFISGPNGEVGSVPLSPERKEYEVPTVDPSKVESPVPASPASYVLRFPENLGGGNAPLGIRAMQILAEMRAKRASDFRLAVERIGRERLRPLLAAPTETGKPIRFGDLDPALQAKMREDPNCRFTADTILNPPKFVFLVGTYSGREGGSANILYSYR